MNKANLDLGRLIGEFKLTCEVEGKSVRTIEWYFSFLRQFEEYLRRSGLATYVNEIDKGYIRQYISFLQRDGEAGNHRRRLAPATCPDPSSESLSGFPLPAYASTIENRAASGRGSFHIDSTSRGPSPPVRTF